MVPCPSKLKPRPLGGGNADICIEPNVDTTCFSIRQENADGTEDLIHFCDWPAMRATIDQWMIDRAAEAQE